MKIKKNEIRNTKYEYIDYKFNSNLLKYIHI